MSMLMKASNEWMRRPADERFASLADLHANALASRNHARQITRKIGEVEAFANDAGDVLLRGKATGQLASPTYTAFGQMAAIASAPPSYLRTLPAPLAAECINTGFAARKNDDTQLLFDAGQHTALKLRAVTSDSYSRIYDVDVTSRLLALEADGRFQPAPSAFDGSRGLYRGDASMFAFMVDNDRRIFERGPGGGLSRGFFAWNSEVGKASFGIMTFLYEFVCGNHRVWGASGVTEVKLRHVGDVQGRAFSEFAARVIKYADSSVDEDELRIQRAHDYIIGASKEQILDRLFGLRNPALTKGRIERAIDLAEQREDWYGNPRSAWGMAGAITEIARDLPNAEDRLALDRAGAKVMELAF